MNTLPQKTKETLQQRWNGFDQCIQAISDALPVRQIVLFGSYAKGEAKEASDVDLCIVSDAAQRQMNAARIIRNSLWKVKNCPPLTLIPITPERLKEKLNQNDPFFEDIFEQGLLLYHEN